MLVEKSIQIIGGKKLTGIIEVSGAKNAVLKQMILPILSEGIYKINNVPNIADVYYMQEVLDVLGITSKLDKTTLERIIAFAKGVISSDPNWNTKVVPLKYSRKILKIFKRAKKKLVIIKNGNHSLSSKKNLKKIVNELNNMIFNLS